MNPGQGFAVKAAAAVFLLMSCAAAIAINLPAEAPTLRNIGGWLVGKLLIDSSFFGAPRYFEDTQALASGALDLSAWHGFQEVVTAQGIQPRRISFDFKIAADTHVSVAFNRSRLKSAGFTFSNYPPVVSKFYVADSEGRFTHVEPLDTPPVAAERWHTCEIAFKSGQAALKLNGELVRSVPLETQPMGRVAFRGSANPALVDNVMIDGEDGQSIRETFTRTHWQARAAELFPALLLAAAVIFGIARYFVSSNTAALDYVLSAGFCVIACALTYWQFNQSIGHRLYPAVTAETSEIEEEHTRATAAAIAKAIRETTAPLPPPGTVRLAFLGTSQTFGVGTDSVEYHIPEQVARILGERFPHLRFETINGAVPGGNLEIASEMYRETLSKFAPQATVINLGFNDQSPLEWLAQADRDQAIARFASNYGDLVESIRGTGSLPFISLEANCAQVRFDYHAMHEAERSIAESQQVAIADPHGALRSRQDEGFIWWDAIHPTTFGMRLIAETIADALTPLVHTEIEPRLATLVKHEEY